jgi:hypothetical protein
MSVYLGCVDFLHVQFYLEVKFEETPPGSLHKFAFNLRISDREFETPGYYRADPEHLAN